MRKVYDNQGVANVFAELKGLEARSNNGNLWCENNTLYSYSTPIANVVEDVLGNPVILCTSHSYSVTTTGKHMNALYRATNSYDRFTVPNLGVKGGLHIEADGDMHRKNLEYLFNLHSSMTKKQRERFGDTRKIKAQMYAEHFGLEIPTLS